MRSATPAERAIQAAQLPDRCIQRRLDARDPQPQAATQTSETASSRNGLRPQARAVPFPRLASLCAGERDAIKVLQRLLRGARPTAVP
jgi:hypothetical protein